MKKLLFTKFIVLAFCALLLSHGSASAQPLGDFDGDGNTDLAVALVQGNTTTWLARLSPSGNPLIFQFGARADYFVAGKFFGDQRTYPGIVTTAGSGPLTWRIRNPQAQDTALSFGLSGDLIPNLGDLDCDGKTDLITTRAGTSTRFPGFRLWYVALSSTGTVQEKLFGLATDSIAVGDTDGDGCSEMIAYRNGHNWFITKLFGFDIAAVNWGLPGDIPLLPQDLNGDNAPDFVVVRPTGAQQIAYIRFSDSTSETRKRVRWRRNAGGFCDA